MAIDNKGLWWPRLLPLLAATVAVGTDAWIVAGFLPALASQLGVTTAAAGLSVTVFAIAYAAGAPVLAALTSAVRPRRVISTALVVLGVANAWCALASGFPTFLAGRVLAALAACVVTPAAGVLAARVAGEQYRGRALALVIAGLTIATAIGVPVGSVVASRMSWRAALWAVAALAWVAAVLIMVTAPNPDGGARQSIAQRLAPLREAQVLAVLGLTALGMTAAYVPYAYTAQLLPRSVGGWLIAVLACYGVGAVAGSLGSGHMTDTLGSRRTLTIAYLLMAASLAGLALRPAPVLVVVMALCWGAASWMQTPPQQHRLLLAAPSHGPVTIGTNASALYAGIALGNTVGSLLLTDGPRSLCVAGAAIALAALGWNLALATPARSSKD